MQEIMEHFGTGLLAMTAVSGTLTIVFKAMEPGGVLHTVVLNYVSSICG